MSLKVLLKKIFSKDSFVFIIGLSFFIFFIFMLAEYSGLYSLIIAVIIFTVLFFVIKNFCFKSVNIRVKFILMFIYLFIFSSFICIIYQNFIAESDFQSYLAYTTDIEKAKEIQKLDKNIVIDKHSTNDAYGLKLWNCTGSCKDYYSIEIAKLYPKNDEVYYDLYYISSNKPVTIKKENEKRLTRIIRQIDGVYDVKVDIQNIEDKENAIANIDVNIMKSADEKEIERIINNLIYYKSKRKININYDYDKDADLYYKYDKKMHKLYKEEKYTEAEELLKEAEKILPKKYSDSLNYYANIEKKYKELDNKIEKEPNNYKYYAQRADISYEPVTDCSPRMFYQDELIDYEKALSLNPNAKDLYEKAGDEACSSGDMEKVKFYYNKAIEYTKNKDNVYAKLGDSYYSRAKALHSNDDYKKALDYYNKIEDVESVIRYREELNEQIKLKNKGLIPEKPAMTPSKGNPWWFLWIVSPSSAVSVYTEAKIYDKLYPPEKEFYWSQNDLVYKIFDCQRKLNLKKEAIKTCKNKAKAVKETGKHFNTFNKCYKKIYL